MAEQLSGATGEVRPGHRRARRIFECEAYRRIAPETFSEFAAQLSAWFKETYPAAPAAPARFVEEAVHDTWQRRHEIIGSEL